MMCMEKHVLVKEIFTNGLNVGFPQQIEQRSVIKFLVAEKCNLCKIYRRMCDVLGEASFSQKLFTSGRNVDLPLRTFAEKTFHGVERRGLSGKKRIQT